MKPRTLLKVGDSVRLTKNSRHGMIKAGTIGVVEEVRFGVNEYTDGICVRFPYTPSPIIARMFPDDEDQTWRCLFANDRNLQKV